MKTAADNRFVTLAGDDNMPEMRLGRLPANVNLADNTIYEARDMVNKILAYEAATPDGSQCECSMAEQNNLLFVADNKGTGRIDFYDESDNIAEGVCRSGPPADTARAGELHQDQTLS